MSQKFHQRFNIEVGLDEAKRRFVNRVNNFISEALSQLYSSIGLFAGERAEKFLIQKLGERWAGRGCLLPILGHDFHKHLRAFEALYEYGPIKERTNQSVKQILTESEIDLGIRWDNGYFFASGSPLLDEKLVNDVLGFLISKGYEGVLMPFRKGLDHFLHSEKKTEFLPDVITDMYEALEALAKIFTGRDRDLSANAELFISKLNVLEEYKPILKAYITYANESAMQPRKDRRRLHPHAKRLNRSSTSPVCLCDWQRGRPLLLASNT